MDQILCINCKKPMKGDNKNWYCTCGMTVWKVTSGKLLSPAHLKQLMEQGQTDELIFKSKKNKPFRQACRLMEHVQSLSTVTNDDETNPQSICL